MANPQKENGYTAIANEIMEQLYKMKFNGTQFRILLLILRFTYGYNRIEHEFSLSFIATQIGSSIKGTKKELDKLIDMNVLQIIARQNYRHARVIRFNKHYNEWGEQSEYTNQSIPNRVLQLYHSQSPDCTTIDSPDCTTPDSPNCTTNKRKYINKIYKENIYRESESNNIYIINYINSQYTPPLSTSINRWIRFKGLGDEQVSALCELVNTEIEKGYTQTAIASVISDCILEGRKKIYFDRLEAKKTNNGYELMSVKPQDIDDFENFLFRRDSGAL